MCSPNTTSACTHFVSRVRMFTSMFISSTSFTSFSLAANANASHTHTHTHNKKEDREVRESSPWTVDFPRTSVQNHTAVSSATGEGINRNETQKRRERN